MKTIKHLFLALVVAIVATSLAAPGNPPVTASSAKPTVSTELEHLGLGPSLPLKKLVLGAADTPPKLGGSTDEGQAAAEETVGAVLVT
ncbi:MAG: hypothetical protein FGM57_00685 [Candidatus Taylorbacteria bacterium]|nr:hypothetical protein [Candidatus Taylorbacteria bacterium]